MQESRSRAGGIDPLVFYPAAGVVAAFVLWGVLETDGLASTADSVLSWVIEQVRLAVRAVTLGFLGFAASSGSPASARSGSARTTSSPSSARPRGWR